MPLEKKIPIIGLSPSTVDEADFAEPAAAFLEGSLSLIWPYSASQASIAFVLAEPDARLRLQARAGEGRVKVVFRASSARAVHEAGGSVGDLVKVGLAGARWFRDGGQDALQFTHKLYAEIYREQKLLTTISSDLDEANTSEAATPSLKRSRQSPEAEGTGYSTPVPSFAKRIRHSRAAGNGAEPDDDESYTSPMHEDTSIFGLDMVGDLLAGESQDATARQSPWLAKRSWKVLLRSPSPEKEVPSIAVVAWTETSARSGTPNANKPAGSPPVIAESPADEGDDVQQQALSAPAEQPEPGLASADSSNSVASLDAHPALASATPAPIGADSEAKPRQELPDSPARSDAAKADNMEGPTAATGTGDGARKEPKGNNGGTGISSHGADDHVTHALAPATAAVAKDRLESEEEAEGTHGFLDHPAQHVHDREGLVSGGVSTARPSPDDAAEVATADRSDGAGEGNGRHPSDPGPASVGRPHRPESRPITPSLPLQTTRDAGVETTAGEESAADEEEAIGVPGVGSAEGLEGGSAGEDTGISTAAPPSPVGDSAAPSAVSTKAASHAFSLLARKEKKRLKKKLQKKLKRNRKSTTVSTSTSPDSSQLSLLTVPTDTNAHPSPATSAEPREDALTVPAAADPPPEPCPPADTAAADSAPAPALPEEAASSVVVTVTEADEPLSTTPQEKPPPGLALPDMPPPFSLSMLPPTPKLCPVASGPLPLPSPMAGLSGEVDDGADVFSRERDPAVDLIMSAMNPTSSLVIPSSSRESRAPK